MSSNLHQEAHEGLTLLLGAFRAKKYQNSHLSPQERSALENLGHYLVLRSEDRQPLQEKLFLLGLSSLGRSFAHIETSVANIHATLTRAMGKKVPASKHTEAIVQTRHFIEARRSALLGGEDASLTGAKITRVMVTLPSDAAQNGGFLIRNLAEAGVHIFRINAAHDESPVWKAMAAEIGALNLARAQGAHLRIYVDLCGPKIRTAKIAHRPQPVRIGSNKTDRPVHLVSAEAPSFSQLKDPKTGGVLPAQLAVDRAFLKACVMGSHITVRDCNGKKGHLEVIGSLSSGVLCRVDTRLLLDEKSHLRLKDSDQSTHLHHLQAEAEEIRLMRGDRLFLAKDGREGHGARVDKEGHLIAPATIACTYKEALAFVKSGERVYIDDGKIGCRVVEVSADGLLCEVFHAKESGSVLKEEKGINFPDTALPIAALSQADQAALREVAPFADMVGLSFAQSPEDVTHLSALLTKMGYPNTGIVAKIETRRGVENLPGILEALILAGRPAGVMIARGDLAIEMGFENLAWLQEEILDVCTAAHLPVIWATQVLESQMKSNLPSRAEVTDAAMGSRAECVMLNKGAFAVDTIRILDRILSRFHELYAKNRQLLSANTLWAKKGPERD